MIDILALTDPKGGVTMLFHKKEAKVDYDRQRYRPMIRQSICTGEQAAGLKDMMTGRFEEVMLIRGEKDLESFKRMYGVEEVEKEY